MTVGSIFRTLHEREHAFVMPNPWDVGSAVLLEHMGFETLATTSSGMAFSMGLKDGQASPAAALAYCRSIVSATSIPVSADLEKGLGDSPESAFRTIVEAAATGLAGCSIEDFSGDSSHPIFDETLAIERIAAAVEAKNNLERDFVLTARCEALLWGESDLDKVVHRLQKFEAVGADVLFAPGLTTTVETQHVCASLSKPVSVVVEQVGGSMDLNTLTRLGVKRVSLGASLARLAYGEVLRAGEHIQTTGAFGFIDTCIDYDELESRFSRS